MLQIRKNPSLNDIGSVSNFALLRREVKNSMTSANSP